jgi:hypothetical protein
MEERSQCQRKLRPHALPAGSRFLRIYPLFMPRNTALSARYFFDEFPRKVYSEITLYNCFQKDTR